MNGKRLNGDNGNPRRVAVFDVDGTIFRSSLLISLVNYLVQTGAFPKNAERVYERAHTRWLDREGDYEEYIQAVIEAFQKHLKGIHYSVLADAAEKVVEHEYKRLYRYTRDLLTDLKKRGYFLLAVSHSPKTILDKFCPKLGFDKVYGTMYDIGPQECFTGTVTDPHLIYNKANILKRAIEKGNLTLEKSIGVGDTESDISFLEMVEEPICFNPNQKLYRYAKRMGWKVVVERKDVVYEF
ncbi:MAG: HAD-IB family hydrolase [bacterium]|nr:HAD-IB family hydrolase [bacterium]